MISCIFIHSYAAGRWQPLLAVLLLWHSSQLPDGGIEPPHAKQPGQPRQKVGNCRIVWVPDWLSHSIIRPEEWPSLQCACDSLPCIAWQLLYCTVCVCTVDCVKVSQLNFHGRVWSTLILSTNNLTTLKLLLNFTRHSYTSTLSYLHVNIIIINLNY